MRLQDKNKKAAIFHATIKLVNEIGFVAASVSKIAKEANVKRLIIGHYSKRYSDLNQLLFESREVFSNTFLSQSGDLIDFNSI